MTDKVTPEMLAQARQIVNSSLFDETERKRWIMEITMAPTRFDARRMLDILAREHTTRERERNQQPEQDAA